MVSGAGSPVRQAQEEPPCLLHTQVPITRQGEWAGMRKAWVTFSFRYLCEKEYSRNVDSMLGRLGGAVRTMVNQRADAPSSSCVPWGPFFEIFRGN